METECCSPSGALLFCETIETKTIVQSNGVRDVHGAHAGECERVEQTNNPVVFLLDDTERKGVQIANF